MDISKLLPAIEKISNGGIIGDLRSRTYLATYPHIIKLAAQTNVRPEERFHQLASVSYGWMPRVLRVDPEFLNDAVRALVTSENVIDSTNISVQGIHAISACLHSVVGASKVLHFSNPKVFPIWDSKIAQFLGVKKSRVNNTEEYFEYVVNVHETISAANFGLFYEEFLFAYQSRLNENGIPAYTITPVRAVEAAAFELAL